MELVLSMFGVGTGLFGVAGIGMLTAFAGLALGIFMLILDFDMVEQGDRRRRRRARVLAGGVRADRQPGVDLHQPAAHPGVLQLGLTHSTDCRGAGVAMTPALGMSLASVARGASGSVSTSPGLARPRRVLVLRGASVAASARRRCRSSTQQAAHAAARAADLGAVQLGAGRA